MALRPLILPAEVGELARPCYADDALLTQIIAESEREDIRPRIGAAIYVALKEAATEEDLTAGLRVLLLGGTWTDPAGKVRFLDGLKTALAYYVYGRVIRDGNITSTRYGAVIKSDENSNSASDTAERQRQYRQAFAAADTMLTEAVSYIIAAQLGGCEDVPRVTSNRARMSVVGTADGGAQRCQSSTPTIIAGKEGASAYEVAVAQGFRGSEAEWLASLVGPQGEPGPEGPQGPAPDMSDYYTKTEADALLEDKADTEEVSTVAAGLASEAKEREAADSALRSQVEEVDARVQEGLSAVGDRLDDVEAEAAAQKLALDKEATARATSDNALGVRINEEADARIAGDKAVLAKVVEEQEARKVADDAVASHARTLVGNEADARKAGDEQSAQLVVSEATARQEADAQLEAAKQAKATLVDDLAAMINALPPISKEAFFAMIGAMPATPSGDPMHWAYIAAGAEYNDTGADIIKDAPWADLADDDADKTVVHKAGYWYLNGLGDITNDKMRIIFIKSYNIKISSTNSSSPDASLTRQLYEIVTNFPIIRNDVTNTINTFYVLSRTFQFGITMVVNMGGASYRNGARSFLTGAYNLYSFGGKMISHIIGYIQLFAFKDYDTGMFGPALKTVKIERLASDLSFEISPLLTCKSILYVIQGNAATSAITITLHADAYARAMASADIIAALEAHPLVTLASA